MRRYVELCRSGELHRRIGALERIIASCTLCPRSCRVDRTAGERGVCRAGALPRVASWSIHHGEERPISGRRGSGTIFFSGCNLSCVFCQNYEISQLDLGHEVGFERLSRMMIELQKAGCHNINFVTPTHTVYAILRALPEAVRRGLSVPLVYNSGGYDSTSTLKILDGVFDVYMPDFKYGSSPSGARFSGVEDYAEVAEAAIREMHRQVGDLVTDERGVAERGLLVRHLVLPGDAAVGKTVVDTVLSISPDTYLNIMDQYRPLFRASHDPDIGRRPNADSVRSLAAYARRRGLTRVYHD